MSGPRFLDHDWFDRPLPSNVQMGEHSWCYSSYAFLHCQSRKPDGIRIGNHTGIYNGTFFDLGPDGEVLVGNYCTLVGAIISANCRVTIGHYCFLAHEVVLSDTCAPIPGQENDHHPDNSEIVLEENCWIGMRASIIAPVRIGHDAIIGAASVVDFNVPPYAIVAGNPATIVGWANKASS